MDISVLIPHIEALIFVADKPLSAIEMVNYINHTFVFMDHQKKSIDDIQIAINHIVEKYKSSDYAFEVKQSGGGWQFLTKAQYYSTVALINQDKFIKKLSSAALETLAIIAYKQPITKHEIESIRGVNSDYAVHKLLEKELITIMGRHEALPGKPIIYGVSKNFTDYFGINNLNELPKIKEVLQQESDIEKP